MLSSQNSTDNKFETFWAALGQCPYDLPEEIKPHLKIALGNAGFFDIATVTTNSGVTVTKSKKLSGYNVFMKEMMAEFKAQNVPSGERMGKVAALWKPMNDEEKAIWKAKAGTLSPVIPPSTTTKSTGTKKLSGYQLYLKETMPIVKINPEIIPKGRMTEIAKMWKAQTEEQRQVYRTKAAQLIPVCQK